MQIKISPLSAQPSPTTHKKILCELEVSIKCAVTTYRQVEDKIVNEEKSPVYLQEVKKPGASLHLLF